MHVMFSPSNRHPYDSAPDCRRYPSQSTFFYKQSVIVCDYHSFLSFIPSEDAHDMSAASIIITSFSLFDILFFMPSFFISLVSVSFSST